MPSTSKLPVPIGILILGGVLLGGLGLGSVLISVTEQADAGWTREWVIDRCREAVKEKLVSPGSAQFIDELAYARGDTLGRYTAKVDAQNRMGALLRTDVICDIDRTDSTTWKVEAMVLGP